MTRFYVYILKCERDNSFYTGYTSNLERRIKEHNIGVWSKYTRSHGPVNLVYYETFRTRKTAMQREREIKKLTRQRKINLIANRNN
ncbi:MAG: GIY-YIG nuclease family protein [Candidatus Helarchaeota archaeon]